MVLLGKGVQSIKYLKKTCLPNNGLKKLNIWDILNRDSVEKFDENITSKTDVAPSVL